jgi:CelD/BcsL family acetyltransferase involved in cellulose biosynthesis
MNAYIDYSIPDDNFWEAYAELWQNSLEKPVFQSPGLMRYFAQTRREDVAVYRFYSNDTLKGAAFFLNGPSGVYSFLSDLKTDHNHFVIRRDCDEAELRAFFDHFHEAIKREKWALVLNNKPVWAPYMSAFAASGHAKNLYWNSSKSSVSPRARQATPQAVFEHLTKSKNNRYKWNRLKREREGWFEVLCGDEDLEAWARGFCDSHVSRWEDSLTPSSYGSTSRRTFLLDCLRSWQADGVLVRFALRVGEERIAFVIGLKQENTLIYHALTHNPAFDKYSPSLVLVGLLGEWMLENGFDTLDFGDGNESYKYNFANEEGQLNSVFISSKTNLPFILRSELVSRVRRHPVLIRLYREKIRPRAKMLLSQARKRVADVFKRQLSWKTGSPKHFPINGTPACELKQVLSGADS